MSRPAIAAGLATVALVAGCAQGPAAPTGSHATHRAGVSLAALRSRAHLSPCPAAVAPHHAQLPDVRLACLSGGAPVRLARVGGVPMIVNIWASWCRPCYQEMPILQRVYAKARGRLRFLGIDTSDSRAGALHAAIDTGVHYPSLFDPRHRVSAGLGLNTQPTTVFVRADGTIADVRAGSVGSAAQLENLVRRYLGVRL